MFKKRSTAIALFVAVVAVFSLVGSHLSLTRAVRHVEDAFFDAELLKTSGSVGYYTCPGDQLENCVALSNRLLSVIGSDGEWADAYANLQDRRFALVRALEDRDIPFIFEKATLLMDAVADIEALKASGAVLPDSHDDFDAIISDLYGAQRVAADPAYNNHVQAFIDGTLSRFPTNILRRLTFVSLPEAYR